MALSKPIELDNGIILNYHRVVRVNIVTNKHNLIEVNGYISQEQRAKEADDPSFSNVYVEAFYFDTDYNQNMTIDDAYEYLKQQEMFQGATDC